MLCDQAVQAGALVHFIEVRQRQAGFELQHLQRLFADQPQRQQTLGADQPIEEENRILRSARQLITVTVSSRQTSCA